MQDAPKIAKRMTLNIVFNCVALHWTVFVKLKKWLVFIPIFCDILDLRVEDSNEEEDSSNEVDVEIGEETIIKYCFKRGSLLSVMTMGYVTAHF